MYTDFLKHCNKNVNIDFLLGYMVKIREIQACILKRGTPWEEQVIMMCILLSLLNKLAEFSVQCILKY